MARLPFTVAPMCRLCGGAHPLPDACPGRDRRPDLPRGWARRALLPGLIVIGCAVALAMSAPL